MTNLEKKLNDFFSLNSFIFWIGWSLESGA